MQIDLNGVRARKVKVVEYDPQNGEFLIFINYFILLYLYYFYFYF